MPNEPWKEPTDPVHFDPVEHKWFFWDETWSDRYGPFETQEIAQEECTKYDNSLDGYQH